MNVKLLSALLTAFLFSILGLSRPDSSGGSTQAAPTIPAIDHDKYDPIEPAVLHAEVMEYFAKHKTEAKEYFLKASDYGIDQPENVMKTVQDLTVMYENRAKIVEAVKHISTKGREFYQAEQEAFAELQKLNLSWWKKDSSILMFYHSELKKIKKTGDAIYVNAFKQLEKGYQQAKKRNELLLFFAKAFSGECFDGQNGRLEHYNTQYAWGSDPAKAKFGLEVISRKIQVGDSDTFMDVDDDTAADIAIGAVLGEVKILIARKYLFNGEFGHPYSPSDRVHDFSALTEHEFGKRIWVSSTIAVGQKIKPWMDRIAFIYVTKFLPIRLKDQHVNDLKWTKERIETTLRGLDLDPNIKEDDSVLTEIDDLDKHYRFVATH